MKRLILSLIASICLVSTQAQRQEKNRPEPPQRITAAQRTQQMKKQLGLTQKQTSSIAVLNKRYAKLFTGPGQEPGSMPPSGIAEQKQNGNPPTMPKGNPPMKPKGNPTNKQKGQKPQKPNDRAPIKGNKPNMPKGNPPARPQGRNMGPQGDMNQFMQLQKQYDAQLKKILTAKQYSVYQKSHHGPGGEPPKEGMPPQRR